MRILSNSAITLDGRIAPDHTRFVAPGSAADRRHMSVLRNQADAILVGGNSFRSTPLPLFPRAAHLEVPLRALPIWNVLVSRRLDFEIPAAYLSHTNIRPLLLTSRDTPAPSFSANRSDLQGNLLEVVHCSFGDPTPAWIVAELEARGVQTLLIEGGGDLIYQFLRDDLLDELHLTLCPRLLGLRGAPALVDGPLALGDPFKTLTLVEARVVEQEVFLQYSRLR